MAFPFKKLAATSGEIYCHLFENEFTGIDRNLFWSVSIHFQPIRYGNNEFECSFCCEWITWPFRNWQELNGIQLDFRPEKGLVEASFYMTSHDPVTWAKIKFCKQEKNLFRIVADMYVDFHGYYGDDENPAMPVHAEVVVPFSGILIIPDNLKPKPVSVVDVKNAINPFADLSSYDEPEPYRDGDYIMRPKC